MQTSDTNLPKVIDDLLSIKNQKRMNTMLCKAFKFGFILTFMLFLSGCNAYHTWINRPIHTLGAYTPWSRMETHKGIAATADKRLIIEYKKHGKSNSEKSVICAEPSPDVSQSVLSMLKIGIEAGKKNGNSSGELDSLLSSIPFLLIVRSQGLQFYRDSVFALCQMAMNGWIGDNNCAKNDGNKCSEISELDEVLREIREDAKEIIM